MVRANIPCKVVTGKVNPRDNYCVGFVAVVALVNVRHVTILSNLGVSVNGIELSNFTCLERCRRILRQPLPLLDYQRATEPRVFSHVVSVHLLPEALPGP